MALVQEAGAGSAAIDVWKKDLERGREVKDPELCCLTRPQDQPLLQMGDRGKRGWPGEESEKGDGEAEAKGGEHVCSPATDRVPAACQTANAKAWLSVAPHGTPSPALAEVSNE